MEPILALHSSLSSRAQWRPLADYLGSYYRMAAVDLHGYGASRLTASSITLQEEAARALHRARDLIGMTRPVHLVGHSYGGAVALALALAYPQRCGRGAGRQARAPAPRPRHRNGRRGARAGSCR